ncbi:Microtubule-actin cross-linking factor 1, isoforms 1/2/3/5 [Liparis tanakae]|uniref:Microtubule-actin cross-linking factor 1, isoforms 1/2/3/5 n=1 Tax=Liparis tanakae TaxID=230148 RepID=A0A4Z2GVS0_9TELE|nr:Microtubule-actin cross-linking factor 1, isoforms 1/2/3/5 [Liparis tanakae]
MDLIGTMEEAPEQPKRRPLVRAASEESSSALTSLSYSSSPGDTLPWNLPKHHRMKRSKSASGDVMDPTERAVIRIAVPMGEEFNLLVGLSGSSVSVRRAECDSPPQHIPWWVSSPSRLLGYTTLLLLPVCWSSPRLLI